jgi:hypothetical protein
MVQWSHLVCVGSQRDTECSCQAKVGQFQIAITVNEQILRLEITMQNTMAVAVTNSFHQLGHELLDHSISETHVLAQCRTFGQRLSTSTLANRKRLHILLEIEIKKFKNKIEFVAIGMDNVQKSYNIRIAHLLEKGDLANGSARNSFIFCFKSDLLQGNNTVGMGEFTGLIDDTVGSYPWE